MYAINLTPFYVILYSFSRKQFNPRVGRILLNFAGVGVEPTKTSL